MIEQLLTIEQAADRLALHPETVRRQLVRGQLRGIRRGRLWRIPESALMESTPASGYSNSSAGPPALAPDNATAVTDAWSEAVLHHAAARLVSLYEKSLREGGDLTASTTAPGSFYDPADYLAEAPVEKVSG